MRGNPLWVPLKLAAVFLSFTSYNLDIPGDYRQGLFFGVVNVSLLGYNLIILYSFFSFFYYPAAGPSFIHLRYTKLNTTTQTRSLLSTLNSISIIAPTDPTIANCKIDVYLMSTLTADVSLQTLDTNSETVKHKLDVYLMSIMLGNFTTTEAANVLLQTLGTNSIIVKCKLDVYLMSTMVENYATAEMTNASLQTLGMNSMIVRCKLDVFLMSTMLKNCFGSVTVLVSSQILGNKQNDRER